MATESGPRQLVLKSLALVPLPRSLALAMARVPRSLALAMALVPQSLAPVLKSLARKPRPPTDLFCWTLLPSTASASRPETSGAIMVACTQKPGQH